MRDYTYQGRMTVEQMPTDLILECLRDGIEIRDSDGHADPIHAARERMELELFIRERGLRE